MRERGRWAHALVSTSVPRDTCPRGERAAQPNFTSLWVVRATLLRPRPAPCSNRHLREVVAQRHVLGEFLLRNSLLDLELSVFHAADIAIDDADMVLLADDLVALRMRQRIRHLHAFKRADDAFDVLARLVAG